MQRENIKKKHHFVSQFYLKAWSIDSHKIYTRKLDQITPYLVRTAETAASNYLYKNHPLSKQSISFLDNFAKLTYCNELTIYSLIIKTISEIHELIDFSKQMYTNLEQNIPKELIHEEKSFYSNPIEDYYCLLESKFSPIIRKIIENRFDQLTIDDYDLLLLFVTSQSIRSEKRLSKIRKKFTLKFQNINKNEVDTLCLYLGLLLDHKLHQVLTNKIYTISIIENNTNINLITSDNPVINTKFKSSSNKEVEYVIPISPKYYLHIKENMYTETIKEIFRESFIQDSQQIALNKVIFIEKTENILNIERINHLIHKESNRYLYGLTKEDLLKNY